MINMEKNRKTYRIIDYTLKRNKKVLLSRDPSHRNRHGIHGGHAWIGENTHASIRKDHRQRRLLCVSRFHLRQQHKADFQRHKRKPCNAAHNSAHRPSDQPLVRITHNRNIRLITIAPFALHRHAHRLKHMAEPCIIGQCHRKVFAFESSGSRLISSGSGGGGQRHGQRAARVVHSCWQRCSGERSVDVGQQPAQRRNVVRLQSAETPRVEVWQHRAAGRQRRGPVQRCCYVVGNHGTHKRLRERKQGSVCKETVCMGTVRMVTARMATARMVTARMATARMVTIHKATIHKATVYRPAVCKAAVQKATGHGRDHIGKGLERSLNIRRGIRISIDSSRDALAGAQKAAPRTGHARHAANPHRRHAQTLHAHQQHLAPRRTGRTQACIQTQRRAEINEASGDSHLQALLLCGQTVLRPHSHSASGMLRAKHRAHPHRRIVAAKRAAEHKRPRRVDSHGRSRVRLANRHCAARRVEQPHAQASQDSGLLHPHAQAECRAALGRRRMRKHRDQRRARVRRQPHDRRGRRAHGSEPRARNNDVDGGDAQAAGDRQRCRPREPHSVAPRPQRNGRRGGGTQLHGQPAPACAARLGGGLDNAGDVRGQRRHDCGADAGAQRGRCSRQVFGAEHVPGIKHVAGGIRGSVGGICGSIGGIGDGAGGIGDGAGGIGDGAGGIGDGAGGIGDGAGGIGDAVRAIKHAARAIKHAARAIKHAARATKHAVRAAAHVARGLRQHPRVLRALGLGQPGPMQQAQQQPQAVARAAQVAEAVGKQLDERRIHAGVRPRLDERLQHARGVRPAAAAAQQPRDIGVHLAREAAAAALGVVLGGLLARAHVDLVEARVRAKRLGQHRVGDGEGLMRRMAAAVGRRRAAELGRQPPAHRAQDVQLAAGVREELGLGGGQGVVLGDALRQRALDDADDALARAIGPGGDKRSAAAAARLAHGAGERRDEAARARGQLLIPRVVAEQPALAGEQVRAEVEHRDGVVREHRVVRAPACVQQEVAEVVLRLVAAEPRREPREAARRQQLRKHRLQLVVLRQRLRAQPQEPVQLDQRLLEQEEPAIVPPGQHPVGVHAPDFRRHPRHALLQRRHGQVADAQEERVPAFDEVAAQEVHVRGLLFGLEVAAQPVERRCARGEELALRRVHALRLAGARHVDDQPPAPAPGGRPRHPRLDARPHCRLVRVAVAVRVDDQQVEEWRRLLYGAAAALCVLAGALGGFALAEARVFDHLDVELLDEPWCLREPALPDQVAEREPPAKVPFNARPGAVLVADAKREVVDHGKTKIEIESHIRI
ncbi:hypothetical protein BX661DRAFT_54389 [Kickxella alabastrina]|uniref:uncharacterized protein n=1 Tax=Kickxella alabastrina TaxID=61397 RepID=UPI002220BFED|nr:uncharacterized protein BX661DRAFT_54389 [Kickxella alabastrina]KAI7823685.1 hypothetical protein BX661DRAFT_54389 [Kickxella alabastrina]